jgi:hypothetical protein
MIEYLIRATDEAEFAVEFLPRARFDQVLMPHGFDAVPIDGWGDYRIRIDDVEIAFSAEDPGWQVSFEGEIEPTRAMEIAQTISTQLERESRRPHQAVRISRDRLLSRQAPKIED